LEKGLPAATVSLPFCRDIGAILRSMGIMAAMQEGWMTNLVAMAMTLIAIIFSAGAARRFLLRLALRRAWKEDSLSLLVLKYLGGKRPRLDEFEDGLPSLPVPPLSETLKRWLSSLEPILDEKDFAEARASAAELETSPEGRRLQRLLEERAACSRNWLSDWWEEFAYLRNRLPLPTYANFFCTDSGSNLHEPSHETDQVKRVASLINAAMDFKHRVDSNTLLPLRIRGVLPVCMAGMRRIFGTTRVPGRGKDEIVTHQVHEGGDAHVLLSIGSSLFCLPVLVGGLRVSNEVLEAAICAAIRQADSQGTTEWGSGRNAQPCISLLTSCDRDSWAACRQELLSSSASNAAAVRDIEKALFGVALLDRPVPSAVGSRAEKGYIISQEWARRTGEGRGAGWEQGGELAASGIDMQAYVKEVLHGDGRSIWYDKSFTIVSFADGRIGFHYEHTYADAPVPGLMCEHTYINTNPRSASARRYPPLTLPTLAANRAVSVRLIAWESVKVRGLSPALHEAANSMARLLAQVDIQPIHWLAFGAGSLKRLNISPDAFCQAVLQVAALRYFGKHVLTYESASLRTFHHGRTECIRTASSSMTAFARAFVRAKHAATAHAPADAVSMSLTELGALLRRAGAAHSRLAKQAAQMEGVDRHLLGLRLVALTNGLETPPLFLQQGWLTDFRLTTSQSPIVQEFLSVSMAGGRARMAGRGARVEWGRWNGRGGYVGELWVLGRWAFGVRVREVG
jgi:hypothetical protein